MGHASDTKENFTNPKSSFISMISYNFMKYKLNCTGVRVMPGCVLMKSFEIDDFFFIQHMENTVNYQAENFISLKFEKQNGYDNPLPPTVLHHR